MPNLVSRERRSRRAPQERNALGRVSNPPQAFAFCVRHVLSQEAHLARALRFLLAGKVCGRCADCQVEEGTRSLNFVVIPSPILRCVSVCFSCFPCLFLAGAARVDVWFLSWWPCASSFRIGRPLLCMRFHVSRWPLASAPRVRGRCLSAATSSARLGAHAIARVLSSNFVCATLSNDD